MRRIVRLARRIALWAALAYVLVPIGSALVFALVPPPITPLMILRLFEGEGLQRDWVPLEAMSPRLARAVIAAEDNLFCTHHGFDWESLREAVDDFMAGKRTRGASTISMQTTKNLFLWPHSSFARKVLEPYPTLVLELVWSKRRILEVYLNVAEWGPGIYGAEAAARAHFGKSAAELGKRETALLAAVLPNPRAYSASAPSDYVASRASTIAKRAGQLGELTDCVVPQ
ncbi:MAG: monofunctional biosynthetic peptidoglycan transglycosylase [Alphaproteobacteria bacterium]|nr:monofunctional biosynthetic peptidoglycan transglycosylase [Alphaproteobacteria bacterium]